MNQQLKHVAQLIKTNQRDDAHQALRRYVADQPQDAWAWYFFSFTMPTTQEKITAAQRALTLAPDSEKFQARLDQLLALAPMPRAGMRFKAAMLASAAGIIIMALAGAVLLTQNLQSSSRALPTLVALADAGNAAVPTQQVLAADSNENIAAAPVISETPQESADVANIAPTTALLPSATPVVQVANVEAASLNPTSQIISAPQSVAIAATAAQTNIIASAPATTVPEFTTEPDTAGAPTTAPTQSAPVPSPTSAPPIEPTPPVVIITDTGAPLNTALNIGMGDMRVITATRSAETYIREMGGSMPAAPANQSWVLVEVLLTCQKPESCAADPSRFKIVGASGAAYGASPQLMMDPILGSAVSNSQVWGYVGFVVPNSESQLKLILSQGSQNFAFALQ